MGFVQKIESPGRSKSDFIVPVYNALKAVDPIGRGLSAAVLVLSNMAISAMRKVIPEQVKQGAVRLGKDLNILAV